MNRSNKCLPAWIRCVVCAHWHRPRIYRGRARKSFQYPVSSWAMIQLKRSPRNQFRRWWKYFYWRKIRRSSDPSIHCYWASFSAASIFIRYLSVTHSLTLSYLAHTLLESEILNSNFNLCLRCSSAPHLRQYLTATEMKWKINWRSGQHCHHEIKHTVDRDHNYSSAHAHTLTHSLDPPFRHTQTNIHTLIAIHNNKTKSNSTRWRSAIARTSIDTFNSNELAIKWRTNGKKLEAGIYFFRPCLKNRRVARTTYAADTIHVRCSLNYIDAPDAYDTVIFIFFVTFLCYRFNRFKSLCWIFDGSVIVSCSIFVLFRYIFFLLRSFIGSENT